MKKRYILKLLSVIFLFSGLLSSLYTLYTFRIWKSRASQEDKKVLETKFVENELLVKVKKEVKYTIKEGKPDDTGIASLNKLFKEKKVNKFEKVFKTKDSKSKNSDIDQWYKVTFEKPDKSLEYNVPTLETFKLVRSEFIKDPNIEKVEPNYIAEVFQTPAPENILSPFPTVIQSPTPTPKPIPTETPTQSNSCAAMGGSCMQGYNCGINGCGGPGYCPLGQTCCYVPCHTPTPTLGSTSTPTPIPTIPPFIPNDPFYSSSGSWGQPYDDLWGLKKIDTGNAWNRSQGEGIVVAVVDTGVDRNHEDITDNMWVNTDEVPNNGIDDDGNGYVDDYYGWDFVTFDGTPEDNDPIDDHGHGSHVSGTIAATGNNGLGVIGVAPKSKIMALKGLNNNGSGSVDDLSRAIIYAANNDASVINASWGGTVPKVEDLPQILRDAVNYAHDSKNVTFVAAAGNSSASVATFFPAAYRNVITVASSDHLDQKSDFSNYGVKIDVSAPGGDSYSGNDDFYNNILSLKSNTFNIPPNYIVGSNYYRARGTSMASPHVAGVATLTKSLHPTWNPEQIRQAVRKGADDILTTGFDQESGYGRLNAFKSLNINEPLSLHLTKPIGERTNLDSVPIYGYAYGTNFSNWRLEYGLGETPVNWNPITSSYLPVTEEDNLVNWDVSNVWDGNYTIRLIAQNKNLESFEDRTLITLNRIYITQPAISDRTTINPGLFRGGENMNIIGTAAVPDMVNYLIKVFKLDGTEVTTANISLINGGTQKVRDGLLGSWDTNGIEVDTYSIRLICNTSNGSMGSNVEVIVDPSLHAGWPKNLGTVQNGASTLVPMNHTDVADVNNDGKPELLYGYGNLVHILDNNANELTGWPQSVDKNNLGCDISGSPAVGDVNNDGVQEIVKFGCNGELYIWNTNGILLNGYPKLVYYEYNLQGGVLEDIDGNGTKDIIYVSFGSNSRTLVYAMDANGNSLNGWPVTIDDMWSLGNVAVGDLNHDGVKEIVIVNAEIHSTGGTGVYVIKTGGQAIAGWPKFSNADTGKYQNVILADLDNDQNLELLVTTTTGKVFAYRYDGSILTGWPQSVDTGVGISGFTSGDVNADGKPEVVAGDLSDKLFVWNSNGQLLNGWPVQITGDRIWNNTGFTGISIADIDSDGKGDIIAEDYLQKPLIAYKFDASVISGFPKLMYHNLSFGNPAIADIDGDGLLELSVVDNFANAIVYDLGGTKNNIPLMWPMFAHDERHTSSLGILAIPTSIPTPSNSPIPTPTPRPTTTPTPRPTATSTPRPTATPAPLPTSTPTPTLLSCSVSVLPSTYSLKSNQSVSLTASVTTNGGATVNRVVFTSANTSLLKVSPTTDYSYAYQITASTGKINKTSSVKVTALVYLNGTTKTCSGTSTITVSK